MLGMSKRRSVAVIVAAATGPWGAAAARVGAAVAAWGFAPGEAAAAGDPAGCPNATGLGVRGRLLPADRGGHSAGAQPESATVRPIIRIRPQAINERGRVGALRQSSNIKLPKPRISISQCGMRRQVHHSPRNGSDPLGRNTGHRNEAASRMSALVVRHTGIVAHTRQSYHHPPE